MFFTKTKKKNNAQEDTAKAFLTRFRDANASSIPGALENGLVCDLLCRAINEYNSGRYKDAILTLEFTVPKCDNDDDRALVACFLALFYYDESRYDKARAYIDVATALRPQFKSALNLMKRVYDIVNECRNDKDANPDLIKLRYSGSINVSDLDILHHNIDVEKVRELLDNVDRSQFDRKLEQYRKYRYRKAKTNIGSYKKRLSDILNDFEECAPREFFESDTDNIKTGRRKQKEILEQVQDLCEAQKEVILRCEKDIGKKADTETRKKLLLFSTWHFYLAGYARYQTMNESGEYYHIIHRTMFPYAKEIENCLKERFPDLNVAEEIGRSTKEFGAKLANIIKEAIGREDTEYDRMVSDITWLFLDECGMKKSDPVSLKLYNRLYGFIMTDMVPALLQSA